MQQSFVGTDGCVGCHRPQAQVWGTTKHALEFSGLPVNYRNDPTCLKCHVTAFGDSAGYVAGMPAKASKNFAVVGCEMCHGPGALHKDAAEHFANANGPAEETKWEKELKATIHKTPSDSVCATCHTAQAHQQHPAYVGQPLPKSGVGRALGGSGSPWFGTYDCYPPAGTNIKACAACHYQKYTTWMSGNHVDLSANMPAKYANDKNCLKCHAIGYAAAGSSLAGAHPSLKADRLGVACESCHGPAREHVAFNRQFISSPPLGPEMEQMARQMIRKGKPANSCVECHVLHAHQEHPKYDKL